MDRRFSFASVVLSYFLVGGGMFSATLLAALLHLQGNHLLYALLGAGAFVGGFIAARASRGSTILEPGIGAVAVIATILGLAASSPLGRMIWSGAQDEIARFIALAGGASVAGALIGAFLSERLFGEATRSSAPWLLYTALSVFGGSLLSMMVVSVAAIGGVAGASGRSDTELGSAVLLGMGIGCLLAGLAGGASARTRPLLASLVGGAAGCAGFFVLLSRSQGDGGSMSAARDTLIGLVILAVGGGIAALIGTALGWAAVGKGAAERELPTARATY
ncbi:MAG TPA: hypothetical protein VGC42_22255 [Kofleriaceae bacterium]